MSAVGNLHFEAEEVLLPPITAEVEYLQGPLAVAARVNLAGLGLPSSAHNCVSISLAVFLALGIARFPPTCLLPAYLCQRLEWLFQVHHIQVSNQRKRLWPGRQIANSLLPADGEVKENGQPCCQIEQRADGHALQQACYGHGWIRNQNVGMSILGLPL